MKKIVFEPQPWNELEFNWNEYVWSAVRNPCSPDRGAWEKKNMLLMNIPNKISASGKGIAKIPIPICVFYSFTESRVYKYSDPEYRKMIHVKCVGEAESAFFHYLIEVTYNGDGIQEVLAVNPLEVEFEKERLEMIQKCKQLPDEMLEEGTAWGEYLTFNLSDSCGGFHTPTLCVAIKGMNPTAIPYENNIPRYSVSGDVDYMNEPLSRGTYEIYFTCRGLESEHRMVEIAYEE